MRISTKADYAVRAAIELATMPAERPVQATQIATAQDIPVRFLENILAELRQGEIVRTERGPDGGYYLAGAPADFTIADVVRAVEGPLACVRGERPDQVPYLGATKPLRDVWLAMRANVLTVLEAVTLADVVADDLPEAVRGLSAHPASFDHPI